MEKLTVEQLDSLCDSFEKFLEGDENIEDFSDLMSEYLEQEEEFQYDGRTLN